MTDEDGTVVSTIKYYPFGLTREQSGTLPTDELFTGQQKEPDDILELYHYNARIYSAAMGRFLSVDPIASSGQRLNPYSYVLNNPLKYIDPSGMCVPDIDCPGDGEAEPTPDPYVEQAAAEDWVNAPPMQPEYEPCQECIAWRAAAIAYEQAAELEAWAGTAPAGPPPEEVRHADSSQEKGGGCGNPFCKVANKVANGAKAVGGGVANAAKATGKAILDGVGWCYQDDTCIAGIGTTMVVIGFATGNPGLILAGSMVITAADGRGCINGSKSSCAFAAADLASVGTQAPAVAGFRYIVPEGRTAATMVARSELPMVGAHTAAKAVNSAYRSFNGIPATRAAGASASYTGPTGYAVGSFSVNVGQRIWGAVD